MPSDQPILISVDLPRPGDVLGSYVIERQLGQGGMAVVYEACHQKLGKRVAIKMLMPHQAARGELAQRFQREGEAAARLDHPNAVTVLDAGNDTRGTPYLVLEYLQGEDLASLLKRAGRLTVEQTADFLVPVIAAIAVAHDLGIVHRDLKPENVFLSQRRQQLVPKVLDFGISKTSEAESMKLTRSESLLGTPHYMSPEQAQGAGQADAHSDQFALGVILYECVTGKCPFEGNSLFAVLAAIVGGSLTPPSELVEALDPAFEAIVTRALSKDPAERFPDLRSLGAALLLLASARTRLNYGDEMGSHDNVPGQASHFVLDAASADATSRADNSLEQIAGDTDRTWQAARTNLAQGALDAPQQTRAQSHNALRLIVAALLMLAAAASMAVAASDVAPATTSPAPALPSSSTH